MTSGAAAASDAPPASTPPARVPLRRRKFLRLSLPSDGVKLSAEGSAGATGILSRSTTIPDATSRFVGMVVTLLFSRCSTAFGRLWDLESYSTSAGGHQESAAQSTM